MRKPEPEESQTLAEMEAEWERLLAQCLKQCTEGRCGLFANSPIVSVFVDWPEAQRLRSLARQIKEMYATSGSVHAGCELFLRYCSQSGNNIRGDPTLAAALLAELAEQGSPG